MSTYWYVECPEHSPPLRSHGEFTQHTGDGAFRDGVLLVISRPLAEEYNADDSYFERNIRPFLYEHPLCPLILVSETGERMSVHGAGEDMALLLRAEIEELRSKLAVRERDLENLLKKTGNTDN